MTDLTQTIIAKSDQLNSDDLLSGPITIKITKVSLAAGEQPIAINYEGDNGKPFMPCKTVRRVLVHVWGSDGTQYVGRSMTLYRDGTVTFGGQQVGGIRVSHMSHLKSAVTLSLTATRKSKKPMTILPLTNTEPKPADTDTLKATGNAEALKGSEPLKSWWKSIGGADQKLLGAAYLEEMKTIAAGVTGDEEISI